MTAESLVQRLEAPKLLVAGVWRIGGGSWNARTVALSAEADSNVYLVTTPGSTVLVDCGTRDGAPMIRRNLERIGLDHRTLGDLLLTHSHWDHTAGAADWQAEANGLRTHLNSVGSAFLGRGDHRLVGYQIDPPPHRFEAFRVDDAVADNETFRVGAVRATAHHLPGHTPDSTLYTVRHEGLTLGFCGDIAFRPRTDGRSVLGQLCSLWLSDLDHYVSSLRRMLEIRMDVLLPGHGEPVLGVEHVRRAIELTLELATELAHDERVRENLGI